MLIHCGSTGIWALKCFNGYRPQVDSGQAEEGGRERLCSSWRSTRWEDGDGHAQLAPLSSLLLKVFYQYTHSSALRTSCSQRPKHTIPNQSHRIGRGAKVSSNLNLISKSPWSRGREAPLEGNSEQESDCEGSINLYDYSPFAKSQWDQFVVERSRLILAKKQSLYQ